MPNGSQGLLERIHTFFSEIFAYDPPYFSIRLPSSGGVLGGPPIPPPQSYFKNHKSQTMILQFNYTPRGFSYPFLYEPRNITTKTLHDLRHYKRYKLKTLSNQVRRPRTPTTLWTTLIDTLLYQKGRCSNYEPCICLSRESERPTSVGRLKFSRMVK